MKSSKKTQLKIIGKKKAPEEEKDEKCPDGWYTEHLHSIDYPWLQKVNLFNHTEQQVLKK
jgi:hypothetical protein